MRHEREGQPRPAWQRVLAEFQRLRDRAAAEPTVGNMLFAEIYLKRLAEELKKPGTFELGHVVYTPGARDAMAEVMNVPAEFLIQHKHGVWGELDPEDVKEYEYALERGFRLLSNYPLRDRRRRVWVITEADRSTTCLLLPEEY